MPEAWWLAARALVRDEAEGHIACHRALVRQSRGHPAAFTIARTTIIARR